MGRQQGERWSAPREVSSVLFQFQNVLIFIWLSELSHHQINSCLFLNVAPPRPFLSRSQVVTHTLYWETVLTTFSQNTLQHLHLEHFRHCLTYILNNFQLCHYALISTYLRIHITIKIVSYFILVYNTNMICLLFVYQWGLEDPQLDLNIYNKIFDSRRQNCHLTPCNYKEWAGLWWLQKRLVVGRSERCKNVTDGQQKTIT